MRPIHYDPTYYEKLGAALQNWITPEEAEPLDFAQIECWIANHDRFELPPPKIPPPSAICPEDKAKLRELLDKMLKDPKIANSTFGILLEPLPMDETIEGIQNKLNDLLKSTENKPQDWVTYDYKLGNNNMKEVLNTDLEDLKKLVMNDPNLSRADREEYMANNNMTSTAPTYPWEQPFNPMNPYTPIDHPFYWPPITTTTGTNTYTPEEEPKTPLQRRMQALSDIVDILEEDVDPSDREFILNAIDELYR